MPTDGQSSREEKASSMPARWLALAVLVAGLLVSIVTWHFSRQSIETSTTNRFATRVAELHAALQSRLTAYAQVLRGGQGYVGRIGHPTRDDWALLYRSLRVEDNYPGFTGFVYIRAFDAQGRDQALADIRRFEPGFAMRPPGNRDYHTVVTSVEPRTPRNLPIIGSDSWANPERRRTLESARDSGETRITGRVTLMIDDKPEPAFLMYQAVYRGGIIPDTVIERQNNLMGFVTAGFRVGALMAGTLPARLDDVSLRLFDGSEEIPAQLIYESRPGQPLPDDGMRATRDLVIGNHVWRVVYTSQPGFISDSDRMLPLALLLGGVVVSLLLSLTVWTMAITRARALILARDMTRSLRESESKQKELFAQAPLGIVLLDASGDVADCNEKFAEYMGSAREAIIGFNPVTDARDRSFSAAIEQALAGRQSSVETIYTSTQGGRTGYYYCLFQPVYIDGELMNVLGIIEDVSEKRAAEAHIQYLAHHDALTSLANRTLLKDRLAQAIHAAERTNKPLALLFLDLDYFKIINDSLGHSVGDSLLVEVAQRLRGCVRESDTLARIGGDEFVVVMTNLAHTEDAVVLAEKLISQVAEPVNVDGRSLNITASVGIAVWPGDGKDGETLTRNADTALYHAKHMGRNNFQFFTEALNQQANEALAMETALRNAIRRNEMCLHYQPQMDARTGRILGAEALIRWKHPEWGMVPPDRFIPFAEERGLINAIGEWVLKEACRQMRQWRDDGLPAIPLAVNISASEFRKGVLAENVRAALQIAGLAPSDLIVEITESTVMDDTRQTIDILDELKAMGVRIEIDDFGTGYSSLSSLKRLPIHRLKIDQSFVRDVPGDPEDVAIIDAILHMAASLHLEVIAEGVETQEQKELLQAHGCHAMQGYYYSRPLAAEFFAELLRKNQAL